MAMVLYDKAYKQKGFMRLGHFLKPRVLDAEKFEFPRNSVLHWVKISDKMEYITKDYAYFKNLPDAYVSTITDYTTSTKDGKYMEKQVNIEKLISENTKLNKTFDYLRPSSTKKKKETLLSIYNYSGMNLKYIYNPQPLLRYYRFKNSYSSILEYMFTNDVTRNKFLIIELPVKLLKRMEYEKYAKNLTNAYLDKFPTDESLMLLEFWKYIDINLHSTSIFSKIPINKTKDVNILFKYNNKFLWLTLNIILRSIKEFTRKFSLEEYNYTFSTEDLIMPKISPKPVEEFKKMFYVMLEQFIELPISTEAELAAEDDEENKTLAPVVNNKSVPVIQSVTPTSVSKPTNLTDMIAMLKEKNDIVNVYKSYNLSNDKDNDLEDTSFREELEKLDTQQELDEVDELSSAAQDKLTEENIDDINVNEQEDYITLLDQMLVENADSSTELINNIDDILNNKLDYGRVENNIENLRESKQITKAQAKSLKEAVEKQKKLKDPFKSKKDLTEILDDTKDNINITDEEVAITNTNVIFDSSYNKNITDVVRNKYVQDQYYKDIVRSVYSLQNSKFIIDKYEVKENEDPQGNTQDHNITIKTLDNKTHTVSIILPVINKNGTFTNNGMDYLMRWQRMDIPIKKIEPTIVKLQSYYGKFFIQKAKYARTNVGEYLRNTLNKLSKDNKDFGNLIFIPSKNEGVKLPQDYEHFARSTKYIEYKNYVFFFDYNKRTSLFKDLTTEGLSKIETKNSILVGRLNNVPIVMDELSRLYLYKDNKYNEIPDIYEILGINRLLEPVEFTHIKITNLFIPTVYLLCYYYGLNQLIKVLGTEVRYLKPRERVTIEKPCFVVKFKDVKLVITRDYGLSDMILGGLLNNNKLLITVNSTSFNKKEDITAIFTKLGYSNYIISEIGLLENLFVDPMTASVLKDHKYPTNFKGLLIKANELLLDDYKLNNNDIKTCTVKGYERIAGLMYNELMLAIRDYERKNIWTKAKISINPYAVFTRIQSDSTTTLIDNINPMAELKQREDVSYLGQFGFNKDAVKMESRAITPSEIGVISEAAKDNGDVGLTSYLSANPNIVNTRGEARELDTKDGVGAIFTPNALLMPFALADDPKRLTFSNIMASHVIPINNMRASYVRTGYEAIVAARASDKFVISAEAEGTVTKVTPSAVEVKYKDKTASYKIKNWTSKEESESCYTHIMKANVKQGDKVIKDDTLIYDTAFFEPDVFNPKRVIYKQGDMINVALMEEPATHEDSAALSVKVNNRLGTTVTKVHSIIIKATDNVFNIVRVGDKVQPSDILLSYSSAYLSQDKADKKVLELLKNISTSSPKAKVEGQISKILVKYNCELADMSKTLRDFVTDSDKKLKSETGYTGRVLNNNYAIKGSKLLPGEVEIKVYIVVNYGMGIGDKGVFSNQLKFTVGKIFENDITGEDGTPVEAKFSYRAISARIVNSCMLNGTTSMVMEKLQEQAVKLYFGNN